jgi:hypothetical protein
MKLGEVGPVAACGMDHEIDARGVHVHHRQFREHGVAGSISRHTLEVSAEYTGLVVRPGDKLVVAISRRLNMQEADDIDKFFAAKLPGVEVVPIDNCVGLAVYRDERLRWQGPGNAGADDNGAEGTRI